MHTFGFSALLLGMLRRHRIPGIDDDIARRDEAVRRLGGLLCIQLLLLVVLSVVVR
jgi:hypothetical protein